MQTRTRKNIIPKTGQTSSDATGDDGYIQAGWPKNGSDSTPRFIDAGKNEIIDRAMNLVWIKRPELIIPTGLNADDTGIEKGDWATGVSFSAGDIATKSSDSSAWICLVSHTSINPPAYATATPYSAGDIVQDASGDGTYYQCNSNETSNGATIADDIGNGGSWTQIATDLPSLFDFDRSANPSYWSQSVWATSNGSGGVNPVYMPQDYAHSYNPNNALDLCVAMNKGGKAWKLPNVKELVSLVDYGRVYPAIDTSFFPNTQSDYYWTSTVYAGGTDGAWFVHFGNGYVGSYYRSGDFYVRPCRQY